jgi:gas vesicle protein
MKSEKIIIGSLAVFVSGFVLGVLLAPEKGSVTRGRISGKMNGYTGWLMKLSDDMLTELVQQIDTIIERRTDISRHP